MKKQILTLSIAFASLLGYSQTTYIHHSPDDCVSLTIAHGDITSSVIENPETGAVGTTPHTDVNVYSYLAADKNDFMAVTLPEDVNVGDDFTIRFKYYTASSSGAGNIIVRMYNGALGRSTDARVNLPTATKTGGEWQEYEYTTSSFPQNNNGTIGVDGNYINRIQISPASSATTVEALLIDDIEFEFAPTAPPILPDTEADLATDNQWIYNHPSDLNTTPATFSGGSFETGVATPTTDGNSSANVLKFTRSGNDGTQGLEFTGANVKYNEGDGKITVRIYPECSAEYTTPNVKLRVRFDGDSGTQIQNDGTDLTYNVWNEVSLDLTEAGNQSGLTADGIYNQVHVLFNQSLNVDADDVLFYIDALQAPTVGGALSNDGVTSNDGSIHIYPNPATDYFTINSNEAINNVSVYSLNGQLVKSFSANKSYDVSNLATGLYSVKVSTASGSKTIKLIKK